MSGSGLLAAAHTRGRGRARLTWLVVGVLLLTGLATATPAAAAAASSIVGAWEARALLPARRVDPGVFAVPGGLFVIGDRQHAATAPTALRYDIASDSWTTLPSPPGSHDKRAASAQLADGRVVLVGGGSAAVDVWDPATSSWSQLPAMSTVRSEAVAVGVADGRLLVVSEGASYQTTAEIYDPATGLWTATPAPGSYAKPGAAGQLGNGRVLMLSSGFYYADLWDPATGVWTRAANVPGSGFEPGLAISGNTAVVVGKDGTTEDNRDAWRYQESTNTWVALPDTIARRYRSSAVTLSNGDILVVGGAGAEFSAEVLDVDTWTWSGTGRLSSPHVDAGLVAVGDGAYVVGGWDTNVAARYDPAAAAPASDPRISATSWSTTADANSRMAVRAETREVASQLPIAGAVVRMEVLPGGPSTPGTVLNCPNSCRADADGFVTGTYANTTAAGVDTVRALLDLDGDGVADAGEPTATATVQWTRKLTQVTAYNPVFAGEKSSPGVSAYLGWVYDSRCDWGSYGGGGCVYYKAPLAGRTLSFYGRLSNTPICSGVTGANGIAQCGVPPDKLTGIVDDGLKVVFAGDSLYDAHTGYVKVRS